MEGSHHFPWHNGVPEPFAHHERGRERQERRDAMVHRERILEVAGRLFAEHGVDAVSMHQIAMAAGIGQGTLYRRYAHKGDLCMDLMRERHEQFMEEIVTLCKATAKSPSLERLDKVLARCVAFLEEQGALLAPVAVTDRRHFICDEPDDPRRLSPYPVSIYLWLHDLFSELFAEAVERGELAPLDISFTSDTILSTLNPLFFRFQQQERGLTSERILQGLRRIYIDGLKTPPPPPAPPSAPPTPPAPPAPYVPN